MEITTVADDLIVAHDGLDVVRLTGLAPDTDHDVFGRTVRTLSRLDGPLLCRLATVNDVHFGEVECGRIDDHPHGPILRAEPGDDPYPETMNRAAVSEMSAIDPIAVVVKGDLSNAGQPDEWAAFERCYRAAFGERLLVARGNHDAYDGQTNYAGDRWVDLPGVAVAVLDTVIPTRTNGTLSADQLDWLDAHAAAADRPVIVMAHHPQWVPGPGSCERPDDYFGLHPDPSDALAELIARRPAIVAYTAGHTHRHRVRKLSCGVPTIEVGCVKDFPGTWAEYRVHEGGILQVVHRVSAPAALAWSERCRHLYRDFGIDYERYALGALGDRCLQIALRSGHRPGAGHAGGVVRRTARSGS